MGCHTHTHTHIYIYLIITLMERLKTLETYLKRLIMRSPYHIAPRTFPRIPYGMSHTHSHTHTHTHIYIYIYIYIYIIITLIGRLKTLETYLNRLIIFKNAITHAIGVI